MIYKGKEGIEMHCSEFMELLDNYEMLSENQISELEKHCAECESCRNEYEFFKSIISVSSSIPVPKTPQTLIADVNSKLDSERTQIFSFKPNFRILSTVAACLAIGLAVGINNVYIKKNIEPSDGDGVISESVVSATQTPVEDKTDNEAVTAPVPTEKETAEIKAGVSTEKPVNKAVKSTPAVTKKPESTSVSVINNEVETQAPQETPENTPGVNDYTVQSSEASEEHAYRRRFSTSRTSHQFSDYLYVKSEDMGAVVSTMSELGFVVADGYYMGSREDLHTLIDILNERGIAYECMLKYNTGENIAFNLQYS